jgi:hypothetical protein
VKPLPRHLRDAVSNVSTTIQELVYAVALHACGLPEEPRPNVDGDTYGAWRRNHPTPEDQDVLRAYVYSLASEDVVDRCAIGVAALAGRSAREIESFFEWQHIKGRLERLRAAARRHR